MRRLITVLVMIIVMLSGALMFLLGRTSVKPTVPVSHPVAARPIGSQLPSITRSPKTTIRSDGVHPVMVGGERNRDACSSVSKVVGLNPNGDNFVAVKTAPSLKSRRLDKLGPGQLVYTCEENSDRTWIGVVYEAGGQLSERCGVMTSIVPRQPYAGPCQSGWVFAEYLELVAG